MPKNREFEAKGMDGSAGGGVQPRKAIGMGLIHKGSTFGVENPYKVGSPTARSDGFRREPKA